MKWVDGSEIGRNSNCRCGSNLKFKKCCLPGIERLTTLTKEPGVASYLTYNDFWPQKKNSPELVIKLIAEFESRDVLRVLAQIGLAMRDSFYKPIDNNEKELLQLLLTPVELRKLEILLRTKAQFKIITRQLILAAMQTVLRFANGKEQRHLVLGNENKLGESLLRLSNIIENVSDIKIATGQENDMPLRALWFRTLMIHYQSDLKSAIGRYWAILKYGLPAVKQKYPKQYYDFEKTFEKILGISIEQMLGQAIGIFYHYRFKPLEQILGQKKEFILGDQYFSKLKPVAKDNAHKIFEFLGITFDNISLEYQKIFQNTNDNYFNLQPIWNHPMLKVEGTNGFFPLDLEFLEVRMTEGIYWSVFDELKKIGDKNSLTLLKTSFGHAFEWYVNELLKVVFKRHNEKQLWLEWENEVEGVDAVIREDKTWFLVEITSSGLTYLTRISCDYDRIERELRTIWFGEGRKSAKMVQLYEIYQKIKTKEIQLNGLKHSEIDNIIPVLVTLQDLPQHEVLWQWYRKLMREQSFSEEFIGKVIILNSEEVEMLCYLKQNGKNWSDLIGDKQNSIFRSDSMKKYLEYGNLKPKLNQLVERMSKEAFDYVKRELFN